MSIHLPAGFGKPTLLRCHSKQSPLSEVQFAENASFLRDYLSYSILPCQYNTSNKAAALAQPLSFKVATNPCEDEPSLSLSRWRDLTDSLAAPEPQHETHKVKISSNICSTERGRPVLLCLCCPLFHFCELLIGIHSTLDDTSSKYS